MLFKKKNEKERSIRLQIELVENARRRAGEQFHRMLVNHGEEKGFHYSDFCDRHNNSDDADNLNHRYAMLMSELRAI